MTLGPFDHLLVIAWVVVVPSFAALVVMPRLRRAGERAKRIRTYARTIVLQWSLTAALLVLWVVEDRSWGDLGLRGAEWWRLGGGFALVAVAVGMLTMYRLRATGDEVMRRELEPSIERLRPMLPRTRPELAAFIALSATAGIAEELFFRGYLLVYLEEFVPLVVAVALALAVFGAGHVYQGWQSTLQTAALGAVFLALYLVSGALWPAIVFHAAYDMNSGTLGYSLIRSETPPEAAAAG
ncbi:MAG: type II CAAX endopeptidase family protein [Dehalococcoidia bacterium]